jgi:anti-sigma B factor antagonist
MAFSFKTEELKGSVLFIFSGKLTSEADSQALSEKIDQELIAGHPNFIFDLTNLTQCNSSGLNVMIRTLTKSRTANGDLVLFNLNEALNQLFTITKINEIFSIYSNMDDAKKHFKK